MSKMQHVEHIGRLPEDQVTTWKGGTEGRLFRRMMICQSSSVRTDSNNAVVAQWEIEYGAEGVARWLHPGSWLLGEFGENA